MYAIRNTRTKKWIYGTWWQSGRVVQRTATNRALVFAEYEDAKTALCWRRVGKDYEIVPVRLVEIEEKG